MSTALVSPLLRSLQEGEVFRPSMPASLREAGLNEPLAESLVCKTLLSVGEESGRGIAKRLCLPFGALEKTLHHLRSQQMIVHAGAAPLNDVYYTLTETGRERARSMARACAYVGPAPVPLDDYILSVEAQTIRAEAPQRARLEKAFEGISIDPTVIDCLGPAINSGAGLFLYGAPGNGKSTIAKRITRCFGHYIWIPRVLLDDGQFIKLFDEACHKPRRVDDDALLSRQSEFDPRWVQIRRPTVVVGGELTMDNLEIRHDERANVCEAPLQLKSNCGCFLIDDFGRQRIEPRELLNRWIIPLENRMDFLTLPTGKKIQVPFDQLIIFSTNLDPTQLADEAFLRRIPYKVEVGDPSEAEFQQLFELYARQHRCAYRRDAVEYLLETHYRPHHRPLRRCQPRDLLSQVANLCRYNGLPMEMREDYFDRVARSYFTAIQRPRSGDV
ncbi:MAG: AAA family ATPase [Pirellulaceae bacterium]